jgi:hypothetical protein
MTFTDYQRRTLREIYRVCGIRQWAYYAVIMWRQNHQR